MEATGPADMGLDSYLPARFYALVIGINDYEHWHDLRCAVGDARDVVGVLREQYAFGDVKLLIDGQATRERILDALDPYLELDDTHSLLIYYAGHGWMDRTAGTGYWIPSDARLRKKADYIANACSLGTICSGSGSSTFLWWPIHVSVERC